MSREMEHRRHIAKMDDDDASQPKLEIDGLPIEISKIEGGFVSYRLPYDGPTGIETLARRIIDDSADFETTTTSEDT